MSDTGQIKKAKAIFVCLSGSPKPDKDVVRLAKSIRDFGGKLADNPIWVLVPAVDEAECEKAENENTDLNVKIIPFVVDKEAAEFPLADKVFAAAHAEKLAEGQADMLIWMDSESLVLSSPDELVLEASKDFAYRPVDITNIGSISAPAENAKDFGYHPIDPADGISRHNSLIDSYWNLLYEKTGVAEDRVFTIKVSCDENLIRAYLNAGLYVVRPEKGLLQKWCSNFKKLYLDDMFVHFYEQDFNFKLFMHQSVLTCTVLSMLSKDRVYELPHFISYPIHLHSQYPAHKRPKSLNEIKACRHYGFFEDMDWEQGITAYEPLRSWIYTHFKCAAPSAPDK